MCTHCRKTMSSVSRTTTGLNDGHFFDVYDKNGLIAVNTITSNEPISFETDADGIAKPTLDIDGTSLVLDNDKKLTVGIDGATLVLNSNKKLSGNYISDQPEFLSITENVVDVSGLVTAIGVTAADINATNFSLDLTNTAVAGLTAAVTGLTGSSTAMGNDITTLQNDVGTNTTAISTLNTAVATNTTSISTMEANVTANTTDIATLTTDVLTNTSDIANKQNHHANLDALSATTPTITGLVATSTKLNTPGSSTGGEVLRVQPSSNPTDQTNFNLTLTADNNVVGNIRYLWSMTSSGTAYPNFMIMDGGNLVVANNLKANNTIDVNLNSTSYVDGILLTNSHPGISAGIGMTVQNDIGATASFSINSSALSSTARLSNGGGDLQLIAKGSKGITLTQTTGNATFDGTGIFNGGSTVVNQTTSANAAFTAFQNVGASKTGYIGLDGTGFVNDTVNALTLLGSTNLPINIFTNNGAYVKALTIDKDGNINVPTSLSVRGTPVSTGVTRSVLYPTSTDIGDGGGHFGGTNQHIITNLSLFTGYDFDFTLDLYGATNADQTFYLEVWDFSRATNYGPAAGFTFSFNSNVNRTCRIVAPQVNIPAGSYYVWVVCRGGTVCNSNPGTGHNHSLVVTQSVE